MTRSSRPSAHARGYDAEHRAEKRRWQRRIDAGELVRCRRGVGCKHAEMLDDLSIVGGIIGPDTKWDLGHPDRACPLPRAPEHFDCNRATKSYQPSRRRPAEQHPGLTPPGGGPLAG